MKEKTGKRKLIILLEIGYQRISRETMARAEEDFGQLDRLF